MPADLAALLQGEPGGFGILLAQQLLRARLLGGRAALAAPALLALHACRVQCIHASAFSATNVRVQGLPSITASCPRSD